MYIVKKLIKKILSKYYIYKIKKGLSKRKKNELIEKKGLLNSLYPKKDFTSYARSRDFKNEIDLSIIIPLYNSESFVNKCVDSILLNKTKYVYEIILVDDGSTDKTYEIINDYQSKYQDKIKALHKDNGGASSARNYGLDVARGKYISFLDSDDYIGSNYIERLIEIGYKYNVDIVKCGTENIDFKNNKVISRDIKEYEMINGKMKNKILSYPSYVWGGIYKSKLLNNIKFPEGNWYEDMIWRFLIYRQATSFININEIHHYRNMHEGQITKKINKDREYRCLDHLYLIEALVKDNDSFNLDNDIYLYLNVLLECSKIMVNRIDNLEDNVKEQVFIRVYKLVKSVYKNEYEEYLNGYYKIVSNIILNKRYDLWLLLKNV